MYAAGCWHLVSGHLDGPWENVVTALVRETREEAGVVVDPADVRAAVTVHHRSPTGGARLGVFFEVRRWDGIPEVMEHRVCDAMAWFALDKLPEPMVAYCRAGLDAYRAGARGCFAGSARHGAGWSAPWPATGPGARRRVRWACATGCAARSRRAGWRAAGSSPGTAPWSRSAGGRVPRPR
ncbi:MULTISPECIES: NUDIX domain-containing protein [Streptomyces]|uniref:NUDIX domain-containing protein n=1 Tax=Streptomyces TaxID=1883 RepID=UPI001F3D750A|nr:MULTISPECIES: NUDIX domain-containing protein [Streptomyces]